MQAQVENTIGHADAPGRAWSWPLMLVVTAAATLLGATVALWAYYGTAVFYETILAGIAACM